VRHHVIFHEPPLHSPAEKESDIVSLQFGAGHHRPLGAGARMQTIARVVVTVAVLDMNIVAYLPTDAIAIKTARNHAPQAKAIAFAEENAAHIVAIQELVIGPITVEADVLDGNIRYPESIKERKQRSCGGATASPVVLHQHLVEFEAVAASGHQRALVGVLA